MRRTTNNEYNSTRRRLVVHSIFGYSKINKFFFLEKKKKNRAVRLNWLLRVREAIEAHSHFVFSSIILKKHEKKK